MEGLETEKLHRVCETHFVVDLFPLSQPISSSFLQHPANGQGLPPCTDSLFSHHNGGRQYILEYGVKHLS